MFNISKKKQAELKNIIDGIRVSDFLPNLVICFFNQQVVFTTKKIASRYFTDLSRNNDGNAQSIEFQFERLCSQEDCFYSNNLNLYYSESPESNMNESEFYSLLGIEKFDDFFLPKFCEKYQIYIITKDPLERLFTGLVEKCESEIINTLGNPIFKTLFADKYKLNIANQANFKIKKCGLDVAASIIEDLHRGILIEYSNDTHYSYWNHFLSKFVKELNTEKIQIVDLKSGHPILGDDSTGSSEQSVSNADIYNKLLENNLELAESIIKLSKNYLIFEYEAYEYLMKLNK